ncbi:MAG: mammalian cell entry protein [Mycobacterium sp.]
MENQQTDPDDLNAPSPDPDAPADAATGSTETSHPEVAGRGRALLDAWLAAAVVLFVAISAFLGAVLQPYLADRAAAATRDEVARTAAAAITTLWTYTPDTIDTLSDRAGEYLSGDFDAQYRKFLEAAVGSNKQAQVTDKTDVVGVGVEALNGTNAVALVLTNTTATSPLTHNIPSLKYVGYRLAMKQRGSRWRVTKMATVSFVDLTPKI